jgi:hypothetical protein
MDKGIVLYSNGSKFFLRDVIELKLVLTQKVETRGECNELQDQHKDEVADIPEDLSNVVHQWSNRVDETEEVACFHIDNED